MSDDSFCFGRKTRIGKLPESDDSPASYGMSDGGPPVKRLTDGAHFESKPAADGAGVQRWWAIFNDYRNLEVGTLQRRPWGGGSNMTSDFEVVAANLYDAMKERAEKAEAERDEAINRAADQMRELRERIAELERALATERGSSAPTENTKAPNGDERFGGR